MVGVPSPVSRPCLTGSRWRPLTVWEIWTTVTDEHDSDASYATVRDYVRTQRIAAQAAFPEHADAVPSVS